MSEELAVQPSRLVVAKTEEESMQRFCGEELLAESDALDVRSEAGFIKAAAHLKRIKDAQSDYEIWFKKDPNGLYCHARMLLDQEGEVFNRVYGKLGELRRRVEGLILKWRMEQERKERERITAKAEAERQAAIRESQERLAESKRRAAEALAAAATNAQAEAAERLQKAAERTAESELKQAEAKAAYQKEEATFSARAITKATLKAPGASFSPKYEAVIENPMSLLEYVVAGKLPLSAIMNEKVKVEMEKCLNSLAKAFDGRNPPPGVAFVPKAVIVSRG